MGTTEKKIILRAESNLSMQSQFKEYKDGKVKVEMQGSMSACRLGVANKQTHTLASVRKLENLYTKRTSEVQPSMANQVGSASVQCA